MITGFASEFDMLNQAKELDRKVNNFQSEEVSESSHNEQEIEKHGKDLERQGYRK